MIPDASMIKLFLTASNLTIGGGCTSGILSSHRTVMNLSVFWSRQQGPAESLPDDDSAKQW